MERRWRALAGFALAALACALVLVGCQSIDKEQLLLDTAQADMAELVDAIKTEEYDAYLDSDAASELESVGVDAKTLVESLVGSFSCEVESVGVDGDTGTVVVEVTAVDAATVVETWSADMAAWMASEEGLETILNDQDAAYAHIGQMLTDAFESADAPTITVEHDVAYTWDDSTKTWTIDMDEDEIAAFVTDSFGM